MGVLGHTWVWALAAAVLVVLGFIVTGTLGTILLACGFVALLGAGTRLISRDDPRPPEERRVPAGHSGA